MKKSYLILAAVAATFAACSQNDVVTEITENEVPIGFAASWIDNVTRNAGEMTATNTNGVSSGTLCTNGNTMEVWGWKYNANTTPQYTQIFDNQVVTYTESSTQTTTKWVYAPLKFWDRAADYTFYAVAPDGVFTMPDEDLTTAADRVFKAENVPAVQVLMNYAGDSKIKLATDASGTGTASSAIDYLVAASVTCAAGVANQGNDTNDKDVNFTFNHILSKLDVNVLTTSSFPETGNTYPQIKMTDLKINLAGMCPTWDQKTAGALTPAADDGDVWSGAASSAADYICYDVDGSKVANPLLLTTEPQTVASYFVAPTATGTTASPATGTAVVKIQVEYDLIYDGNNTATSSEHCQSTLLTVTNLTSFVQNTWNKLNITIDPKAIYFDVQTVNNWTTGTTGTIVVQ